MNALCVQLPLWNSPLPEDPAAREKCRLPTWPPQRRLELLLSHLERWLDDPLRVEHDASGHTVWVFDAIGYRVNRRLPGVYPVYRDEESRVRVGGFTTELFRPLMSPNFLPFVLRHHGLVESSRERAQSPGRGLSAAAENRLARNAYRILQRDPRFKDLRERRLPEALALDSELCRITLAARRTLAGRIPDDEYSVVWRHERELRAMARESPGLLPLAVAALEEQRILPYGDALKELHRLFGYAKLAPATWRYLVRHGARILRPVWSHVRRGERTQGALEFLREIERAGHPAPPPEWAIRAWLGFSRGDRTRLVPHWNPVPPEVVRIAFTEARRARGKRMEPAMREDLRLVFAWADEQEPRLDKLQKRAGWPWLLRKAAEAERRRFLLETRGPRSWPCTVGTLEANGLRATEIESVEQLVDEGMAFHNCIASYARDCQLGARRLFVVRDGATGRRLAVARLDHDADSRCWELVAVLGFANARVDDRIRSFAQWLAHTYDARSAGERHPAPGEGEAIAHGLAALEELPGAGGSCLEPGD